MQRCSIDISTHIVHSSLMLLSFVFLLYYFVHSCSVYCIVYCTCIVLYLCYCPLYFLLYYLYYSVPTVRSGIDQVIEYTVCERVPLASLVQTQKGGYVSSLESTQDHECHVNNQLLDHLHYSARWRAECCSLTYIYYHQANIPHSPLKLIICFLVIHTQI